MAFSWGFAHTVQICHSSAIGAWSDHFHRVSLEKRWWKLKSAKYTLLTVSTTDLSNCHHSSNSFFPPYSHKSKKKTLYVPSKDRTTRPSPPRLRASAFHAVWASSPSATESSTSPWPRPAEPEEPVSPLLVVLNCLGFGSLEKKLKSKRVGECGCKFVCFLYESFHAMFCCSGRLAWQRWLHCSFLSFEDRLTNMFSVLD